MKVAHFYHCYCAGEWALSLEEHMWALDKAGFDGPITVGLVGNSHERSRVRSKIAYIFPETQFITASQGWEQVTLAAVRAYAKNNDGAVLYAHSKGASNPADWQDQWRRAMTLKLIVDWRKCAEDLDAFEVDAVGCHWLVPGQHPVALEGPIFGGNFWMARCEYLRSLPACRQDSRHDAETWVGQASPRVLDLLPGMPPATPHTTVGRLVVPV